MSNTVYKTGTVPTIRYRVLAILFFLLATGGLFIGLIGYNFGENIAILQYLSHSDVSLFGNRAFLLNGSGVDLLPGSLFGYIVATMKYYFTANGFQADSLSGLILNVVGFAQVAFIAVAAVASLVLGIVSCLQRGIGARRCAMISGILVTIAYLWPALSVIFFGACEGDSVIELMGHLLMKIDYPIFLIGGISLLIMLVVSIARRKWIGLLNSIIVLLLLGTVYAFTYHATDTYKYTRLAIESGADLNLIYRITILAIIGLLAFNLVLAICRLNAKRYYPFDAVCTGLLFLALVVLECLFLFMPLDGAAMNSQFIGTKLIFTVVLLAAALVAFLLAILNAFLVSARRRKVKAKRISAELSEDPLDREAATSEAAETAYEAPYAPAQAPAQNAPTYVNAPYGPAYAGAPTYQAQQQPAPAQQQQPMMIPQPMPMPVPYPIPQPYPMMNGVANAAQPATLPFAPQPYSAMRPMMPGFGQFGGQTFGAPAAPVYGGPSSPIIVQQAPASPPVVVLQMPQAQPQQAPQPVYYQQPIMADDQPITVQPAVPAYEVVKEAEAEQAPAPVPAAAPEQVKEEEPEVSDFERMMTAIARGETEKKAAPAAAPVATYIAREPVKEEAQEPAYYGPHDEFFESLSENERNEFHTLFINKMKGDFGLPTYVIGGDNAEFFKKIFICVGKFRPFISDGLLDDILAYTTK